MSTQTERNPLERRFDIYYLRCSMTEDELRKKFWWWRKNKDWTFDAQDYTTKLKPSSTNQQWKDREELIAWRYELARRHTPSDQLPPYPEAKEKYNDEMACLEDFSRIGQRRKVLRIDELPVEIDLNILKKESWSGVHRFECDLEASDNQLTAGFLEYVRTGRERRNIKAGIGPKGKRHRPVSWRWPELMDSRRVGPWQCRAGRAPMDRCATPRA